MSKKIDELKKAFPDEIAKLLRARVRISNLEDLPKGLKVVPVNEGKRTASTFLTVQNIIDWVLEEKESGSPSKPKKIKKPKLTEVSLDSVNDLKPKTSSTSDKETKEKE